MEGTLNIIHFQLPAMGSVATHQNRLPDLVFCASRDEASTAPLGLLSLSLQLLMYLMMQPALEKEMKLQNKGCIPPT